MAAKLFIQGVNYSDCTEGLEGLTITYRQNDSKLIEYAISSDLQLTGRGFRLLENAFFDDPCAGRKVKLGATIVLDCCSTDQELDFVIDYEGIQHCPLDCSAKVTLKAFNPLQDCYEYLRDTPYFENGFEDDFDIPKVRYSVQRRDFYFYFILFQFLFVFLVILQAVQAVVNVLLGGLQRLFQLVSIQFDQEDNVLINAFLDLNVNIPSFDDYFAFMTGSGNYHFAPYVKDIFQHNIDYVNDELGCNMSLKFPLLDSQPYSELTIFQPISSKGISCLNENPNGRLFRARAYNRTLTQLTEELALTFNLECRILPNGTFCVDTFENITESAPVALNVEREYLLNPEENEAPCYKFRNLDYCKRTDISYCEDGIDTEGNRNISNISDYSDNRLWDSDLPINNDGVCKKEIPFGAPRFMFDRHTGEIEGFLDSDLLVDQLRSGDFGIFSLPGLFFEWDQIACLPRDHDLIMSEHTASKPKLLVLEPETDLNDAQVIKKVRSSQFGFTFYDYNYPMHLNLTEDYDELMKIGHITDDPNHPDQRPIEQEDYTACLTPAIIELIKENGINIALTSKYGKSLVEEIVINSENCTVTFKGMYYKCTV